MLRIVAQVDEGKNNDGFLRRLGLRQWFRGHGQLLAIRPNALNDFLYRVRHLVHLVAVICAILIVRLRISCFQWPVDSRLRVNKVDRPEDASSLTLDGSEILLVEVVDFHRQDATRNIAIAEYDIAALFTAGSKLVEGAKFIQPRKTFWVAISLRKDGNQYHALQFRLQALVDMVCFQQAINRI